jgi:hypothetical protein
MAATAANVRALLARWAREAEWYYDRDAAFFGLPIERCLDLCAGRGSR